MTTAFVITAHSSDKLRPEGNFYLNRQIESIIKYCKHDFKVLGYFLITYSYNNRFSFVLKMDLLFHN